MGVLQAFPGRSAARSGALRPGIVKSSAFGTIPDQRCTASHCADLLKITSFFASFHTWLHTISDIAWPGMARLYRVDVSTGHAIFIGYRDNAASPIEWRGARSRALPEMVVPSTTGPQPERAVLPQGTDGYLRSWCRHARYRISRPLTARRCRLPLDQQALLSRLIARKKIAARKDRPRTLVDVASINAYYEALPLKTDHAPIVFGRRAHVLPLSRS
jgi:hypothetical protein